MVMYVFEFYFKCKILLCILFATSIQVQFSPEFCMSLMSMWMSYLLHTPSASSLKGNPSNVG